MSTSFLRLTFGFLGIVTAALVLVLILGVMGGQEDTDRASVPVGTEN